MDETDEKAAVLYAEVDRWTSAEKRAKEEAKECRAAKEQATKDLFRYLAGLKATPLFDGEED